MKSSRQIKYKNKVIYNDRWKTCKNNFNTCPTEELVIKERKFRGARENGWGLAVTKSKSVWKPDKNKHLLAATSFRTSFPLSSGVTPDTLAPFVEALIFLWEYYDVFKAADIGPIDKTIMRGALYSISLARSVLSSTPNICTSLNLRFNGSQAIPRFEFARGWPDAPFYCEWDAVWFNPYVEMEMEGARHGSVYIGFV